MPEVPTQPIIPPEIAPLVEKIDEIIEANGSVPQQTKDALLLSVTKSLLIQTSKIDMEIRNLSLLDARVGELEKRNIVTWAGKHPGITIFFTTLIMILLLQHYAGAVLAYLGIKIPMP